MELEMSRTVVRRNRTAAVSFGFLASGLRPAHSGPFG